MNDVSPYKNFFHHLLYERTSCWYRQPVSSYSQGNSGNKSLRTPRPSWTRISHPGGLAPLALFVRMCMDFSLGLVAPPEEECELPSGSQSSSLSGSPRFLGPEGQIETETLDPLPVAGHTGGTSCATAEQQTEARSSLRQRNNQLSLRGGNLLVSEYLISCTLNKMTVLLN